MVRGALEDGFSSERVQGANLKFVIESARGIAATKLIPGSLLKFLMKYLLMAVQRSERVKVHRRAIHASSHLQEVLGFISCAFSIVRIDPGPWHTSHEIGSWKNMITRTH